MTKELQLSIADGIARININRPEARNAMTGDLMQVFLDYVLNIENNPDVRCLVVTGTGEHFMAGGDVKSFHAVIDNPDEELRNNFMKRSTESLPLWCALERIPQPVVCAVRGFSAGVALSLIAGADLVVASENAKFLLAHVGLGLIADGGSTYHLPRAIGVRRAKELAFFGDRIDAQQALQYGLVNWVVPDNQLEAKTDEVAQRLAKGPFISISNVKKLMNESLRNTIDQQIMGETVAIGKCAVSKDLKEGVKAFVEKRKPQFKGR